MSSVKNLILAIQSGKSSTIQATFDSIMAEKTNMAVEAYRQAIIDTTFNVNESSEEDLYSIHEEEDLLEELAQMGYLEEDAKALFANLPKHSIRSITDKYKTGAGENSRIETHQPKSKSEYHKAIDAGLDKGAAVAVHVNGKFHKMIRKNETGGRPDYAVHNQEGQESEKGVRGTQKFYMAKGAAHDRMNHPELDSKEGFKKNNVTVTHVFRDLPRARKQMDRKANTPKMQTNTVNKTPEEKANSAYYSSHQKTTSHTPAGDMSAITHAAASKIADKKLGKLESPANKAKELHAELAKHIESGDHRAALNTAKKLTDHIQTHGIEGENYKKQQYISNLKDLKGGNYSRKYAKETLAKLRNESVENNLPAELVESLDQLIALYNSEE